MARTIGIALFALLVGILIGAIAVHKHHQNLWVKKFDDRKPAFFEKGRGDDPRMNRLPPELMERLGADLHLPDAELARKMESLPFYQRLSLEERGKFIDRLTRIRRNQIELSNQKISALGLQLEADQKIEFHKSMLQKRSANMKEVRSRSQELMQDLEKRSDQELLQEFGGKK
jgi:hypothetical protein